MSLFDSDTELTPAELSEYGKNLAKARRESFTEFEEYPFITSLGEDAEGRKLIFFVSIFLSGTNLDLEKAVRYTIKYIDEEVKGPYSLILCQSKSDWLTNNEFTCLKSAYSISPMKQRKDLKKLYILHGGIKTNAFFKLLYPLISSKFWKKVEYINRLQDLISMIKGDPSENLRKIPYVVQREEDLLSSTYPPISYFGSDLSILSERFGVKTEKFGLVPDLLVKFVKYFDDNAKIMRIKEFLYLQSDAISIYEYFGEIEEGVPQSDWSKVPAVITTFRIFLESFPVPFLGPNSYSELRKLSTSPPINTKTLTTLKNLYKTLPNAYKNTLKYLIAFFKRVHDSSSVHQMTFQKIGELFAPAFCKPMQFTNEFPRYNKKLTEYVITFLTSFDAILELAEVDDDGEDDEEEDEEDEEEEDEDEDEEEDEDEDEEEDEEDEEEDEKEGKEDDEDEEEDDESLKLNYSKKPLSSEKPLDTTIQVSDESEKTKKSEGSKYSEEEEEEEEEEEDDDDDDEDDSEE